jgi:hypothetical protein
MIGTYTQGRVGGHAWVELERHGEWYLIEATRSPSLDNPWKLAEALYPTYTPQVVITENSIECATEGNCAALAACNCNVDKYLRRG